MTVRKLQPKGYSLKVTGRTRCSESQGPKNSLKVTVPKVLSESDYVKATVRKRHQLESYSPKVRVVHRQFFFCGGGLIGFILASTAVPGFLTSRSVVSACYFGDSPKGIVQK